jgi:hypothetical protein
MDRSGRLFGSNRWCAVAGSALLKWSVLMLIPALQVSPLVGQIKADSPQVTGSWTVEINFPNGENRSLQLHAQDGGKGSLLLLDPRSKGWGGAKAQQAEWSLREGKSVIFSGPVEFPIGNVGRDPGRLNFKGQLVSGNAMTGEVTFLPAVSGRPSKHGSFKAHSHR